MRPHRPIWDALDLLTIELVERGILAATKVAAVLSDVRARVIDRAPLDVEACRHPPDSRRYYLAVLGGTIDWCEKCGAFRGIGGTWQTPRASWGRR